MRQSAETLLLFHLDRQRFGVPVAEVLEVARAVSLAQLPKAPTIVEGVINLRGHAVPVLDIRARFGLTTKPIELSDQMIIARARDRVVAIRVDQVADIVTVDESDIEDIKSLAPNQVRVAGVAKLPDGIIVIHNLAEFLSQAEADELSRWQEQLHA